MTSKDLTSVSVPKILIDGPMFRSSYATEGAPDLVLRDAKDGRQPVRYKGFLMGPEHRAVWKVILTQLKIQMDLEIEGATVFIYEDEIFELMGHKKISDEMRRRLGEILTVLCANAIHSGDGVHGKLVRRARCFDGLCEIEVGLPEKEWLDGEQYVELPVSHQAIKIAKRSVPLDYFEERDAEWKRIYKAIHTPIEVDDESDEHENTAPLEPKRKRLVGPGYVYILTNPAMPGLIKIGKTRLNPTDRANQLQTTGVPQGFQVEYACHTPDPEAVEQAMHVAFGPRRVNDRREFFEIEPEQAVAVLALHHQAEPSTTVQ